MSGFGKMELHGRLADQRLTQEFAPFTLFITPSYNIIRLLFNCLDQKRTPKAKILLKWRFIFIMTPLCGWNQTTLWLKPSVTPRRSLDPRVRSRLDTPPCKIRLTVSLAQSHLKTGKNGMSYYCHSDMTHP